MSKSFNFDLNSGMMFSTSSVLSRYEILMASSPASDPSMPFGGREEKAF